jgi:ubiquinol-cytochrome c reductase iron-sulfur subunit
MSQTHPTVSGGRVRDLTHRSLGCQDAMHRISRPLKPCRFRPRELTEPPRSMQPDPMRDRPSRPTRRDFRFPATAGVTAVTGGAAIWGLRRTMSPAGDVVSPAQCAVTVDLTGLTEGAEMTMFFRGKPVLIRHRSAPDIAAAEAEVSAPFHDPLARNLNLPSNAPATDQNRRAAPDGRYLVISPVCTHLGCVVLGAATGQFGGLFCPCHSGHFDTSGRVRRGPALQNLPIPALDRPAPAS